MENVIIIGSGPAGYTAALYTARANLNPLVIEGFLWGGLLQQTTDVENYPGYPEGIMGPEMMQQFRDQAERFGTRFITDNATKFEPGADGEPHKVWVEDDLYEARAVILAMGAEHKKLGVPGEEELGGRGVSYCATCDAAFYKDRTTIIVGGGDSAMEEAIFLAKFASKVTIVHRRDEFRASKIMLERARAMENIEWLTPYVVEEFIAGEAGPLDRARLRNVETGEQRELPMAGAFIAVGHEPQSEIVAGCVNTDAEGYVITEGKSTRTNVPGSVRRRRPRRPHLPPGRDRGRLRLSGGAGRRVVPARQPERADSRGPRGHRKPRRAAVGAHRRALVAALAVAAASRAAAAARRSERPLPTSRTRSTLSTPAFKDGGAIPAELTCDGAGTPPTLAWRARARRTSIELVFVVEDPDARTARSRTGPHTASTAATGSGLAPDGQLPDRRQGGPQLGRRGRLDAAVPAGGRRPAPLRLLALRARGGQRRSRPAPTRGGQAPRSTARSPAARFTGTYKRGNRPAGCTRAPGSARSPAGGPSRSRSATRRPG